MVKDQKIYIKEDGVRFRKTPDLSSAANIIRELSLGQELVFVESNVPWLKVRIDAEEGWVHNNYVSEANPMKLTIRQIVPFVMGELNLANSSATIAVRNIINDEFHGGTDHLNCTEYVQYRVKTKLGIDIRWSVKSGRNGGMWAKIFQDAGLYKVSDTPQIDCAMCFTDGISTKPEINAIGHIAFVEEVLTDGSVRISEANWPRNGMYNERIISMNDWRDKYKAKFILFS
ncbi:MAG: CHAP domain-containing protein [Patescibacteria group bacterium]